MGHVFGKDAWQIMLAVKKIFDPHGILNRGVKTATAQEIKTLLRTSYAHNRHEHLPHS
jgi:hypothetical protein